MELNTEDKQRIEQEVNYHDYSLRVAFIKGAEYATRFEREHQAKECTPEELRQFKYKRMKTVYDNSIRIARENQKLEAEQSELMNKVIEECIDKVGELSIEIYVKRHVIQALNSLKTK